MKAGITGKLLRIIRSLYTDIRACIKSTGQISEEFPGYTGLLQGEVLSPLLFTMYINDLERQFITENCPSVELKKLNLFVLMFADDTVIFSNSPDEMQIMLNSLHKYVSSWNLTENSAKTKVLVFSKGGSSKFSWTYNNEILQQVYSFHYLGLCLNHNGSYPKENSRSRWKSPFLFKPKNTTFCI